MTDRVAPGAQGSTVRNMEYGEMGGAPAPFIVPYDYQTRSAQRWSDLSEPRSQANDPQKGPFAPEGAEFTDNTIALNPGEGFVDGWFATDEYKQSPDLSTYQQELVTVVVGWNPDAVYSSSVHNNREEADEVFCELEQNVPDNKPYIPVFRGTVIESGGSYILRESDMVDLRPIGRPMETLRSSKEPGDYNNSSDTKSAGVNLLRGAPTTYTGRSVGGPLSTPPNANRGQYLKAPADQEAGSGETNLLTLLSSTGLPSVYLERVLTGEGGSYSNRLNAGTGAFPRKNAQLDWSYEAIGDLDNWTYDDTNSAWTYNLTGIPPAIFFEAATNDGSVGGFRSSVQLSESELGGFILTFHDVDFSNAGERDDIMLGFSDVADPTTDVRSAGNGLFFHYDNSGISGDQHILTGRINGANDTTDQYRSNVEWDGTRDIAIGWTGSTGFIYDGDGQYYGEVSWSETGNAYYPIIQLAEEGDIVAENLTVGDITIEPIETVLR